MWFVVQFMEQHLNSDNQKMTDQVEEHILCRYNLLKKVGSGAYGHVWKVTDKKGGETLALKKIFDAFQHSTDAQRTYREISLLHDLNHPNIIKLHNVIKADNDKDLYLVFEFMEADLHNAIGQKILKDVHNRFIIYQIIKGLKYLHSAQIIHRDLKPSNVLINSDCHLKICDFGLARSVIKDSEATDVVLTEEVATRWYRAPEVLLGSKSYDKSADIWSIGCILAEMLIGKPFFPGSSTLNQLERIVSFTGRPSLSDIKALNSDVAEVMIKSIEAVRPKNIKDWFKGEIAPQGLDLLNRMLQFNPEKRATVSEILRHPYLKQFSNPREEIESKRQIYPPVSDNKKLNLKQYRQIIYEQIKRIYPDRDEEIKRTAPFFRKTDYSSTEKDRKFDTNKLNSSLKTKYVSSSQKDLNISQQQRSINNIEADKMKRKSSLKDFLKNTKAYNKYEKPSPNFESISKYYKSHKSTNSFVKENRQVLVNAKY